MLTITLAWFNKITEGTQDEFYNFMSEVMTNNQNLSLEDHSLLNETNQKVNEAEYAWLTTNSGKPVIWYKEGNQHA